MFDRVSLDEAARELVFEETGLSEELGMSDYVGNPSADFMSCDKTEADKDTASLAFAQKFGPIFHYPEPDEAGGILRESLEEWDSLRSLMKSCIPVYQVLSKWDELTMGKIESALNVAGWSLSIDEWKRTEGVEVEGGEKSDSCGRETITGGRIVAHNRYGADVVVSVGYNAESKLGDCFNAASKYANHFHIATHSMSVGFSWVYPPYFIPTPYASTPHGLYDEGAIDVADTARCMIEVQLGDIIREGIGYLHYGMHAGSMQPLTDGFPAHVLWHDLMKLLEARRVILCAVCHELVFQDKKIRKDRCYCDKGACRSYASRHSMTWHA